MDINYQALGQQIKYKRKLNGLTQITLAEQVGIEPSNISHIERAASKVGLNTLVKIANALHCTVDELLCHSLYKEKASIEHLLSEEISDCTHSEICIILEVVTTLKESLRHHNKH